MMSAGSDSALLAARDSSERESRSEQPQQRSSNCKQRNSKSSVHHNHNHHQHYHHQHRSKSRSPGSRAIDRAIVIVHHTTCSHSSSRSRDPSPSDNLSDESSLSFHEHEVLGRGGGGGEGSGNSNNSDNIVVAAKSGANLLRTSSGGSIDHLTGGGTAPPPAWFDGMGPPLQDSSAALMSRGGSVGMMAHASAPPQQPLDSSGGVSRGEGGRNFQYSNWESCRESWFSSGSDCPRPSSGSDCPPKPSYLAAR